MDESLPSRAVEELYGLKLDLGRGTGGSRLFEGRAQR
jgi:hypothetical protein